jgi:EAL domain-containing protein (putative c-di-GMP-specific phosphodiesterase class I)
MPEAFIGVLEAADQIDGLTMAMLASSARACRAWHAHGFDMSVAVNISPRSLSDAALADRILEAVALEQLDTRHVTLEVTETATGADVGAVIENLSRLRMRGFGLSIDDFGTGYSSMQQLTHIPFTELKIDQSFVRSAPSNPSARAVLESSLEIARKLGVPAVAEGVESKLELALLQQLGCPLAQGYYLARPMDEEAFADWMLQARAEKRARLG